MASNAFFYYRLFERCARKHLPDEMYDHVMDMVHNEVQDGFFTAQSSTTGFHHPTFALGIGGVVRHTIAVTEMCSEIMYGYGVRPGAEERSMTREAILIAALLHDSFKSVDPDTGKWTGCKTYESHPRLAAEMISLRAMSYCTAGDFDHATLELAADAVRQHMGPFYDPAFPYHEMPVHAQILALADYTLSRKFLDVDFTKFSD